MDLHSCGRENMLFLGKKTALGIQLLHTNETITILWKETTLLKKKKNFKPKKEKQNTIKCLNFNRSIKKGRRIVFTKCSSKEVFIFYSRELFYFIFNPLSK